MKPWNIIISIARPSNKERERNCRLAVTPKSIRFQIIEGLHDVDTMHGRLFTELV